jgi:hypothetical protein
MVGVSLFSADAVVLVFSLADQDSFEELVRLRELVRQAKGELSSFPGMEVLNRLTVSSCLTYSAWSSSDRLQ